MTSIPLWPSTVPHAQGNAPHDIPTLDCYEPFGESFSDCAVLILPGGGYGQLSSQEGEGYAGMFQLWGFHSFVCNYRLGSNGYRHPVMFDDAARALRMVRSFAAERKFNPNKVVIIGSSAGGHLAATLLTKWDHGNPDSEDSIERMSSRPDLGILCYPVITMRDDQHTHTGSRANLLGEDPSAEQIEFLSAEQHVGPDTPPCFVWHTVEDGAVTVENSLLFAQALRSAGVGFELHCYEQGGHGLGMKDGITWSEDCRRWLGQRLHG